MIGQALRPLIGQWLLAHPNVTGFVDRGSVLIVVYAAFSAGMNAGIWRAVSPLAIGSVMLIDMAVLAAAITITTAAARWFAFPAEDEIAVVFCGSKKSLANGIPMAPILFPGHLTGLIILPLMLYHQIQIFVCTILAQRYARRSPAGGIASHEPFVHAHPATSQDGSAVIEPPRQCSATPLKFASNRTGAFHEN